MQICWFPGLSILLAFILTDTLLGRQSRPLHSSALVFRFLQAPTPIAIVPACFCWALRIPVFELAVCLLGTASWFLLPNSLGLFVLDNFQLFATFLDVR